MAGGLSSQNPCCNVTWVDPTLFGFKRIRGYYGERISEEAKRPTTLIKWMKVLLSIILSLFNDPVTFDDRVDHPMPTGGLSHSKERERVIWGSSFPFSI
jgi:hypothetical protein